MEHKPPATIVTVEPETVHTVGVVELNPTASPDVAVADIAYGPTPYVWVARAPKLMLCPALLMANDVNALAEP